MGLHHTLILLPIYLYFIYLFVIFIFNKSRKIIFMSSFCLISILSINFIFGYYEKLQSKLFTDINLKTPYEKNFNQIKEVSNWLKNNLNENKKAYMITHNNTYNPDKFRNFYMPNLTIYNNLPYGSAVLGVHKFPIELFDSKYIITTTPFENISVENKYNDVFNILVEDEKFTLKKEFNMGDGYYIIIYERIKEVDKDEINLYINCLSEESKLYPALYKEVIEQYSKKIK